MKSTIRLLALTTLITLFGCATSGKFACPAPEGVTCMSPTEIYEATNKQADLEDGVERRQGKTVALPAKRAGAGSAAVYAPVARDPVIQRGAALALGGDDLAPQLDVGPPGPLRRPAQIMRIWVAPWTDAEGDLHMPGYLYTEIRGRTWSVGQAAPSQNAQLFDPNARFSDSATPVDR